MKKGLVHAQNYIYGNFEDSEEGDMIDSINPATGQESIVPNYICTVQR